MKRPHSSGLRGNCESLFWVEQKIISGFLLNESSLFEMIQGINHIKLEILSSMRKKMTFCGSKLFERAKVSIL